MVKIVGVEKKMFWVVIFSSFFATGLANLVLVDEVRVQATRDWNFVDEIGDHEMQKNYHENIEDYHVEDISCSKYCVEREISAEKRFEHVKIKWNLERKPDLWPSSKMYNILEPEIPIRSRNNYAMSSEYACTFSMMVSCIFPHKNYEKYSRNELDFLENITPTLSPVDTSTYKIKQERMNLFGVYEINFEVEPYDRVFDVFIKGNISTIELQIPIGQTNFEPVTTNTDQSEPQVTLSSKRMTSYSYRENSVHALRLSVRNPQQGNYGIKITGFDRTSYDVTITTRNDRHGGSRRDKANLHSTKNYKRDDGHVSSIQPRFDDGSTYDSNDEVGSSDYQHKTPIRFPDDNPSKILEISKEIIKDENDNITSRLSSSVIEERFWGGPVDTISSTSLYVTPIRKPLVVEVFEGAQLIIPALHAPVANHHQIPFRITNNYIVPFRTFIKAACSKCIVVGIRTPNDMPPVFDIPLELDIPPGETYFVIVSIQLPPVATEVYHATLSLIVSGISTEKKDVKITVRDRELPSRYRPTIKPYFNNNCPRNEEKCHETYWSADIYIQGSDTGLMTAESSPRGMYAEKPYESGTQQEVKFYYSNNCCNKIVKILAVDSMGMSSLYVVDVNVWYNLTKMEWVAVALGILLIIAIMLIILILVVKNKRDTLDLSYSQRYGSRSGPRTPTD